MTNTSICFCVPMARPVFEPQVDLPFGGSEVRAYWFATGLAKKGWTVSALVNSHQTQRQRKVDGVGLRYYRMPTPLPQLDDAAGVLRRVLSWPRLTLARLSRSLCKRLSFVRQPSPEQWAEQLEGIAAEWHACFGVHAHAACAIAKAKAMNRRSVLFLASDTDLAPEYTTADPKTSNAYGQVASTCAYCLNEADVIVAQTEFQQQQLKSRFGRESAVIRNPIHISPQLAELATQNNASYEKTYDVLWIGRADRFSKRADLVLEIARRLPALQFAVIMNRRDPKVFRELTRQMPSNVRLVTRVPWRQMDEYFQSSRFLLNTSDAEGFPNTFLQAAVHGLPIFSLNVDPSSMLSKHGCGWCAVGDLESLVEKLSNTTQLGRLEDATRVTGPGYVEAYHALDARCDELSETLRIASSAVDRQKDVA